MFCISTNYYCSWLVNNGGKITSSNNEPVSGFLVLSIMEPDKVTEQSILETANILLQQGNWFSLLMDWAMHYQSKTNRHDNVSLYCYTLKSQFIWIVCSNSKNLAVFLCLSSDEDFILLGQASMGIKNDFQKKKEYFM